MGKYAAMAATRVKRRAELNAKRTAEGLEPISSADYSKMHPLPGEKKDRGRSVDSEFGIIESDSYDEGLTM